MFIVMRYPVLMEDKGRQHPIKHYSTRAEAEQWISNQKDEYFKPSDYFIMPVIQYGIH